ncbi:hypothetical protein A0H81_12816 [Grifola frondosa]|uniref:Uncharacterized protein n=1 Tax=Grifola frondosa TaxID=5627 RepID=A0A1C7LWH7_GRIFR|nr:hypothetical protein A0H81_12816 [Grifola frondosa]
MVLRRLSCWDVTTGKVDKSKLKTEELSDYAAKAEQALTAIGLTVDPSQYGYIRDSADGPAAWAALAGVYEKNSRANRIALKRQFFNFRHDTERPIRDYISGITDLAARLKSIGVKLLDEDITDALFLILEKRSCNTVIFFAEEANNNNSVSIAIVKTTGIAVGFNAQLQNISDVDNFGTVVKNVEVTRGPVVRLYALFIVLVIWLVTLTFMATCVVNVFFGKGISSGVLVLPMGTLFAFTQLRSTLPGAPDGFGAIIGEFCRAVTLFGHLDILFDFYDSNLPLAQS